ncbi:GIY-YIG nuclease family protein [Bacteroides neonati]|uniref:GIY-YIG nuclease family protein n=1 Tax=Bacteroides neonati TaxID=1347393 RepID=UPI0005A92C51|nr:GIY-YIG nuclease family protein [Bacteroides neonati]
MAKLDEAKTLIHSYECKYRNPKLIPFLISDKYDLFPTDSESVNCWPKCYPYVDRAGVYLVMDAEDNILYIGKSSVAVGRRLGRYFGYSADGKSCLIKDENWTKPPKYIVTVAVPIDSPFECASLEEFLLKEIKTSDNYNLSKRS